MKLLWVLFFKAILRNISQSLLFYSLGTGPCNFYPITSLVPCRGPLNVDLNADEDNVTNFLPFLQFVYESIFPGKKLADKPKPWQTRFLLEVTHGGWTLVKNTVQTVFHQSKDLQYGTLLNQPDNYIPLVLLQHSFQIKLSRWLLLCCF